MRVTVSPAEIATFRKSWPCSRLPIGPSVTFHYATNGDLTGCEWNDDQDYWNAEESGALGAMADDAKSGKIGTVA